MMALDCSPGKQFFLTWRKDIFKVFCIYIYQTLPFDGYLFYLILLYFFYFYLFIFFL